MKNYTIVANIRKNERNFDIARNYSRKSDALRGLKRYMRKNHRAVNNVCIQSDDGTSMEFLVDYNRRFITFKNIDGYINTYKFSYK